MSVKKFLTLSAAGVAAVGVASAMAGGYAPMTPAAAADNGYYIEGNVGYARQNYLDDVQWRGVTGAINASNHSNTRGGFAGGVDTGYVFNEHFALELGWYHLPTVQVMSATSTASYMTSYALYLAARYMMPLPWMDGTDLFFKLGAAYRKVTIPGNVQSASTGLDVTKGSSSYVRPWFALGLNHNFSSEVTGILQYAYFMGANNSFPYQTGTATNPPGNFGTVGANVFTVGLGYNFTV